MKKFESIQEVLLSSGFIINGDNFVCGDVVIPASELRGHTVDSFVTKHSSQLREAANNVSTLPPYAWTGAMVLGSPITIAPQGPSWQRSGCVPSKDGIGCGCIEHYGKLHGTHAMGIRAVEFHASYSNGVVNCKIYDILGREILQPKDEAE